MTLYTIAMLWEPAIYEDDPDVRAAGLEAARLMRLTGAGLAPDAYDRAVLNGKYPKCVSTQLARRGFQTEFSHDARKAPLSR